MFKCDKYIRILILNHSVFVPFAKIDTFNKNMSRDKIEEFSRLKLNRSVSHIFTTDTYLI